jgi:hypothetical protein
LKAQICAFYAATIVLFWYEIRLSTIDPKREKERQKENFLDSSKVPLRQIEPPESCQKVSDGLYLGPEDQVRIRLRQLEMAVFITFQFPFQFILLQIHESNPCACGYPCTPAFFHPQSASGPEGHPAPWSHAILPG